MSPPGLVQCCTPSRRSQSTSAVHGLRIWCAPSGWSCHVSVFGGVVKRCAETIVLPLRHLAEVEADEAAVLARRTPPSSEDSRGHGGLRARE